jgi:hypothetical protein
MNSSVTVFIQYGPGLKPENTLIGRTIPLSTAGDYLSSGDVENELLLKNNPAI